MPSIEKRRLRGVFLPILLALAGPGCSSKETSDRSLTFVEVDEAETLVQGRKKLLGLGGTTAGAWVDPRDEAAYREGHIPGAMHIPLEDLEREHGRLDDYDPLIVYGDGYNSPLALAMSKRLIELGHKDVNTLRGGLRAWEAAGYEIETSAPE